MTKLIIDMSTANEWYIEEVESKIIRMGLRVRRVNE